MGGWGVPGDDNIGGSKHRGAARCLLLRVHRLGAPPESGSTCPSWYRRGIVVKEQAGLASITVHVHINNHTELAYA